MSILSRRRNTASSITLKGGVGVTEEASASDINVEIAERISIGIYDDPTIPTILDEERRER